MNPFKSIVFFFLIVSSNGYCQYTEVINSNRPGASRSAFSVGTGVAQLELGGFRVHEKRSPFPSSEVQGYGVDFTARYGAFLEELEFNIEGTFQGDTKTLKGSFSNEENRANFKFLALGVKYLVFDPYKNPKNNQPNLYSWKANNRFNWKDLIPAISVYVGANYDTKTSPYVAAGISGFSPKIMVATQHNFSGGWVFVLNLIKDRINTNQSDFQYIATLTHALNPKWVVFGETQAIMSDFYADNLFRFGAGYLWHKNLQLDTAVTFNTKDTPSVLNLTLGASYRFDFHKDKEIPFQIN